MKNSLTLTVGIPAYNEEANIIQLIDDILKQEYDGLELMKVIVSSDASTDSTDELVRLHPVSYTHLDVYKRQQLCFIMDL